VSEHPSHQLEPMLGSCVRCGMTHEELLDFPGIHCDEAREAQLPSGAQPCTFGPALSAQSALQRALMLIGLEVMAIRTERSRAMCARYYASGIW